MPPLTPKVIKYLIIICLTFGLFSGLFHSYLGQKLSISFTGLFALSTHKILSGYLWQPLSFLFLPQSPSSLDFSYLISLGFDLYLLWFLGCKVHRLFGPRTTLKLFFIPSIVAALLSSTLGYFFHFGSPIFGLSFAMIPLVIAYSFSHPDSSLGYSPLKILQTRWIAIGLLALYLLQDLATLNLTAGISHLLCAFLSYLYMTFFHRLGSPFSVTSRFDQFIMSQKKRPTSSKIIYIYGQDYVHSKPRKKSLSKFNIWVQIKRRFKGRSSGL